MDRTQLVKTQLPKGLRESFCAGEFHKTLELYKTLDAPCAEGDYWAACALSVTGSVEESKKLLEQSLTRGYIGAAGLLAAFCHLAGQTEQAAEFLELLEPFDELEPWDRAVAYRENGKLLDYVGEFQEAQESWATAWNIASQSPECEMLLGTIGHFLASSYEMLGLSESTLETAKIAKNHAIPSGMPSLLYLQMLSACHLEKFNEAQQALAEINALSVNSPEISGYMHYARGVFAYFNGRTEDAIAHFKGSSGELSGIKRDSAFLTYISLFNCYILLDNHDEAQKYLQAADDELISVGPSLPLGYFKRAQAELLLRTGVFDVVRRNPSAPETLDKARVMYEELGLPLTQAQCWIHLASWYAINQEKALAIWCLENAHNLKKEFQDTASFKKELDLAPNAKELYASMVFQDWFSLSEEEQESKAQEFFPNLVSTADEDPAARELMRLVSSGQYEQAIEAVHAIFAPKPSSRIWIGAAGTSLGLNDLAREYWAISPEMRRYKRLNDVEEELTEHEKLLEKMHYLSATFLEARDQAVNARLHLHVLGEVYCAHRKQTRGFFEYEQVHFLNQRTYELFALFVDKFKSKAAIPLQEIFDDIWTGIPTKRALQEFNSSVLEINKLGKKIIHGEFEIKSPEKNSYRLERIKFANLPQAEILSVAYLPLEIEEHLDKGDPLYIWALHHYQTFFPNSTSSWVISRRNALEKKLRSEGFALCAQYLDQGDLQTVMSLAPSLAKLEPEDEDWASEVGKEIKRLAQMLEETPHHLPGELQGTALLSISSEEAFRNLQDKGFLEGWMLISDELNARRATLRLDALSLESSSQRQGLGVCEPFNSDKPLQVRILSTRFVMHHEREQAIGALKTLLEAHGITTLHIEQFV